MRHINEQSTRWRLATMAAVAAALVIADARPVLATHSATARGAIEARPAPVSRRQCLDGPLVGTLCKQNSECGAGFTCQDRNIFNITVSVRFNASAAQLTSIQNAMDAMAASLFDATDGQAQIGRATILNNSTGTGGTIQVFPTGPCAFGGRLCANSGHWATGGLISASIGAMTTPTVAEAGEGLAHEFVHLVFDARDEYEASPACTGSLGTGSASCPLPGSGAERCLMDVGGAGTAGGTELCWGQGNPASVTDLSTGNHDPNNVTEQSQCRSNRSCWAQVGWSWPNTFLVPAGAPDPAANGLTVNPVTFFQPPPTARIVLVLDESGSMSSESPTRMQRLQTAALDFVNLATNGTELGIVSFSDLGMDEVPITALTSDRSAYTAAIGGLAPTANTNIADGLQHARDMITTAGGVTGSTSILLMTDGLANRPLFSATVALREQVDALLADGVPVFVTCTGADIGLDSQCSEIAAGTMGSYVDSAQSANMSEAFADFHELMLGRLRAGSIAALLTASESKSVLVEPGARVVTFVLLWENASTIANLSVMDPDGIVLAGTPIPQGQFVRVTAPKEGAWSATATLGQSAPDQILMRAFIDNPSADVSGHARHDVVAPGQPIVLYAHPRWLGPLGGVQVTGTVTKPDGTVVPVTLVDDGRISDSGDDAEHDGVYTLTFRDTAQWGAYTFLLSAVAFNAELVGHSRDAGPNPIFAPDFEREIRITVAVDPDPANSVPNVSFKPGGKSLLWEQVPGVLDYDIVEGGPSLLPAVITQQPDSCVRTSVENTETGDVLTQTPAPDSLFWYQVVASGGGSAGSASSGPRLLETTGVCTASCAHGLCELGGVVEPACDTCAAAICSLDPFCCNNQWDNICIQEVRTICNSLTCSESAGQCGHALCEEGFALAPKCDEPPLAPSCVEQICVLDPFCCQQAWDSLCVAEVTSICGYNCN